jgi:hypothetical protein
LRRIKRVTSAILERLLTTRVTRISISSHFDAGGKVCFP